MMCASTVGYSVLQNHEGDTALHFACQFGHTEVTSILLQVSELSMHAQAI